MRERKDGARPAIVQGRLLKHRTAVNYSAVARLSRFYPLRGRFDGRKPCEKRRAVLRLLIPLSARTHRRQSWLVSGHKKPPSWRSIARIAFKAVTVPAATRHPFSACFSLFALCSPHEKADASNWGVSPQRQHRHERHSLRFFIAVQICQIRRSVRCA